jgi:hypothetical protein
VPGFESIKINLLVVLPKLGHGLDPLSVHGFDIGSLAGDMAVLGGVIIADDEVRYIGRQVVLVDATKLGYFAGNFGLGRRGQL